MGAAAGLLLAILGLPTGRALAASVPPHQAKNLLTFRVSLSPADYATDASTRRYYDALFTRLRSLPGITAAAAVQTPAFIAHTRRRPLFRRCAARPRPWPLPRRADSPSDA